MTLARLLRHMPLQPMPTPMHGMGQFGQVEVKSHTLHKTRSSSLEVLEYAPGEFDWEVDAEQSACVLSGLAEVDFSDGRSLTLGAGDAVYLPRGLHGHWIVKETLRAVVYRAEEIKA